MPMDDMNANVPTSETGIAVATTSDVEILLKKASKTKNTITTAIMHVSSRFEIELLINSD
jgi:hypothetical protein